MGARAINALLATWLFVSAFVWRHTYAQTENAWVVGSMALIMALGGISGLSWTRYLNVVLGAWLIVSPLAVRILSPLTLLNNELVGLGLIVFGLMPRLRHRGKNLAGTLPASDGNRPVGSLMGPNLLRHDACMKRASCVTGRRDIDSVAASDFGLRPRSSRRT